MEQSNQNDHSFKYSNLKINLYSFNSLDLGVNPGFWGFGVLLVEYYVTQGLAQDTTKIKMKQHGQQSQFQMEA